VQLAKSRSADAHAPQLLQRSFKRIPHLSQTKPTRRHRSGRPDFEEATDIGALIFRHVGNTSLLHAVHLDLRGQRDVAGTNCNVCRLQCDNMSTRMRDSVVKLNVTRLYGHRHNVARSTSWILHCCSSVTGTRCNRYITKTIRLYSLSSSKVKFVAVNNYNCYSWIISGTCVGQKHRKKQFRDHVACTPI